MALYHHHHPHQKLRNEHDLLIYKKSVNFDANFKMLMKCGGKLKCLIFERGKRESEPTLNTQSDSILSRLFI